jgi:hypothetical protein
MAGKQKSKLTNAEIEAIYEASDFQIGQERNDFFLPQIVDYVRRNKWINLRPEYQRRLVWDHGKKSRLIESFLLNVPIPAVFLYEWDLNRYEVMDGQQRLNSVLEFYSDGFALSSLDKWEVLNGFKYSELPERIRKGLDRRRVTATVLQVGMGADTKERQELRRLVFERLNTGGQSLNAQELRNCLYQGELNTLTMELASNSNFTRMWGIPNHKYPLPKDDIPKPLAENRFFKRMLDCEIVLRFFAFGVPPSQIKGSVRSMLDRCMERHQEMTPADVRLYKRRFASRVKLALDIFGVDAFRLPNVNEELERYSPPLWDGIMVALDRQFDQATRLRSRKTRIAKALRSKLTDRDFLDVVVGKPNTAEAIRARISAIEHLLA